MANLGKQQEVDHTGFATGVLRPNAALQEAHRVLVAPVGTRVFDISMPANVKVNLHFSWEKTNYRWEWA